MSQISLTLGVGIGLIFAVLFLIFFKFIDYYYEQREERIAKTVIDYLEKKRTTLKKARGAK